MSTQTAIRLSEFMIGLDHVGLVVPVTVQIAKRTYAGARVAQEVEGCFSEHLYLVGELPPVFRRTQRQLCFRTTDGTDWLLTSWYRRVTATTEWDEVHPWGNHFVLTAYSSLDAWAAEQCGETVRRLQMTVREVGPILSNDQYGDVNDDEDTEDESDRFWE